MFQSFHLTLLEKGGKEMKNYDFDTKQKQKAKTKSKNVEELLLDLWGQSDAKAMQKCAKSCRACQVLKNEDSLTYFDSKNRLPYSREEAFQSSRTNNMSLSLPIRLIYRPATDSKLGIYRWELELPLILIRRHASFKTVAGSRWSSTRLAQVCTTSKLLFSQDWQSFRQNHLMLAKFVQKDNIR